MKQARVPLKLNLRQGDVVFIAADTATDPLVWLAFAAAATDRFSWIRGYISTLRRQGLPMLPALGQAIAGSPRMPATT